jgi:hypothetical protein
MKKLPFLVHQLGLPTFLGFLVCLLAGFFVVLPCPLMPEAYCLRVNSGLMRTQLK